MEWNDKRVLVTGAGGFIGSHLVERLVLEGVKVRAFVHYNCVGTWGWLDDSPAKQVIEIVAGDIADSDSIMRACESQEIIFHLGALIAIPYSYSAPLSYVRTNIEGTLNVLRAARDHGVARVVHTSTSEVYGTARYVPIDEDHPLHGQSPYSASKIGADKMVEAFYSSFEVPVVTVRPFNVYGPRQSARAIVPTIITQALSGSVIRLGNLTPTRDLNYVADTVDGFIRAASYPGMVGETINLGTGREISIGDLAQLICRLIGSSAEIQSDPPRTRPAGSEVERLLANNQKAQRLLEWEPRHTLEEGLERTIEWLRAHISAYRPDKYNV